MSNLNIFIIFFIFFITSIPSLLIVNCSLLITNFCGKINTTKTSPMITTPYIWTGIIIVAIAITIGIIIFLSRKKFDFFRTLNFVFLRVLIPKKESKEDLERERDQTSEIRKVIGIAEHFFTTLHGIYAGDVPAFFKNEDFMSLEYIATEGQIELYINCPRHLK